jgi:hypothetical protein
VKASKLKFPQTPKKIIESSWKLRMQVNLETKTKTFYAAFVKRQTMSSE